VYLLYKYAEKEGLLVKWGLTPAPKPKLPGAGSGASAGGSSAGGATGGGQTNTGGSGTGTNTGAGTNTGGGGSGAGTGTNTGGGGTSTAQPVLTTLDKVRNAALANGFTDLNMDQWCYYAGQLGITCPDPGGIDPGVYEGAWGAPADRTTPIDAGTWWALVQYAAPGLSGGLSGWLT
jgi:hypothetical protein